MPHFDLVDNASHSCRRVLICTLQRHHVTIMERTARSLSPILRAISSQSKARSIPSFTPPQAFCSFPSVSSALAHNPIFFSESSTITVALNLLPVGNFQHGGRQEASAFSISIRRWSGGWSIRGETHTSNQVAWLTTLYPTDPCHVWLAVW